jgi:hypothetical protein
MLFDSSYDLSEITHIQKGLKQLMQDLQSRHTQASRLAYFAGQQLEQMHKTVLQWQANRGSQFFDQPQEQQLIFPYSTSSTNSMDNTTISTAMSSIEPINLLSSSIPGSTSDVVDDHSHVVAGEVAYVTSDSDPMVHEYGWE